MTPNPILTTGNAFLLVTNFAGSPSGVGNAATQNPGIQQFTGVPVGTSDGSGTGELGVKTLLVGGSGTGSIVTNLSAGEYETVAASQTAQVLGATGGVGDYLLSLLIVPATVDAGAVQIKDGNGSNITVFAGGTASLSNLVPFIVPLGIKTVNATTPGWKVTTGSAVSVVASGNFT